MSREGVELLFDIEDEKLLTIGSVVDRLHGEFPDISVSKLRYLEEQGLVMPRRTKSGYRLYSQDDFNRLIRVLTMQRDEYLPLKVIRRELERSPARRRRRRARGCARPTSSPRGRSAPSPPRRSMQLTGADVGLLTSSTSTSWCAAARSAACAATPRPRRASSAPRPSWRATACAPRTCASSRAPSTASSASSSSCCCRRSSRTGPERRREGLDQLEDIVQATTQLRQLLLTRSIRQLTAGVTGPEG